MPTEINERFPEGAPFRFTSRQLEDWANHRGWLELVRGEDFPPDMACAQVKERLEQAASRRKVHISVYYPGGKDPQSNVRFQFHGY